MKAWLCSKCRRGQKVLRIAPPGECQLCGADLGEAELALVDDPGLLEFRIAGTRRLFRGTYKLQRDRPLTGARRT